METFNVHQKDDKYSATNTIRLTFSYEGSAIKLESVQKVKMMSPAEHPVKIEKGHSGFWYEVHDSKGKILFQRVMHNPVRHHQETYGESPDDPIKQQKIASPKGIFEVLIPELENAYSLVLFSSPFDEKQMLAPAKQIGTFNISTN